MSDQKRCKMWLTEHAYGTRTGVPRGWFVRESDGVINGDMFVPDVYDDVSMSGGYPIGSWAFAEKKDAINAAAVRSLGGVLKDMTNAEEQLARSRQLLVLEREAHIRVGTEDDVRPRAGDSKQEGSGTR